MYYTSNTILTRPIHSNGSDIHLLANDGNANQHCSWAYYPTFLTEGFQNGHYINNPNDEKLQDLYILFEFTYNPIRGRGTDAELSVEPLDTWGSMPNTLEPAYSRRETLLHRLFDLAVHVDNDRHRNPNNAHHFFNNE